MKIVKRLAALAGASTFFVAMSVVPAAAHGFSWWGHNHKKDKTVTVTQQDLEQPPDETTTQKTWYFYDDNTNTSSTDEAPGTYEFVGNNGSDSEGSVEFNLGDDESRWTVATNQLAGQDLSKLKELSFDMYTPSSSAGGANTTLFLNFDVDFDKTTENGYQGRLVYVPQQNGTPALDTWETWDTLDDGNGVWWWSRYDSNGNQWPDGNTEEYRTWDDIMNAFPESEVLNESFTGQFLIRAGHPGPDGLQGNVDNIVFGTKHKTTTYDFEEAPAAVQTFEFTQDELDNNWSEDRALPTDGVSSTSAFGRDNVARLGLDSTQTASGLHQRTEGVKTPGAPAADATGNFGNAVETDLYLDPDWEDKAVRAGLWTVGDNGSGERDGFYGIIEFVNNETCPEPDCSNQSNVTDHEGFRIWDSTVGWSENLSTDFEYGQWVTLKIELDEDAEQYKYFISGEQVGTAAAGQNFIREVFLNSYNYGQDNFPNLSSDNYAAHWHGGVSEPQTKADCRHNGWQTYGFDSKWECYKSVKSDNDKKHKHRNNGHGNRDHRHDNNRGHYDWSGHNWNSGWNDKRDSDWNDNERDQGRGLWHKVSSFWRGWF